jgi:hypothetical protein
MISIARAALLAAAFVSAQAGVAAEPGTDSYGRAGGTVGADRVRLISEKPGTMSFSRQLAFELQPGRAGGAAAAATQVVVLREPGSAPVATMQRYGRAGYPLNRGH